MTRFRSLSALVTALVLVAASVVWAQPPGGRRGGFGMMGMRGSLLGLLRSEQVQKELKLSEEQVAKVNEISEKLREEMSEQFAALRDVEDREQQRAKMTELSNAMDRKAREQLRDVMEREQTMRLYQIRMQVRPVVDSLSSRRLAGRLELTEEQQTKLAQIDKEMQAKQTELFSAMRDASDRGEFFQKFRQLRSDTDEKALAVLNDEQKEAFKKMQGEKFELEMRRPQ
jgi:Spy/CpxP family protein refolding chaperone